MNTIILLNATILLLITVSRDTKANTPPGSCGSNVNKDQDKKCKDSGGKCVRDTNCCGKLVKGLCGGDAHNVCCFNRYKEGGCEKKHGKNAVCMKIQCDGVFARCNDQSEFCSNDGRIQCCMKNGTNPIPNSKDCKAAGGQCEYSPCDGQIFSNTELCKNGKQCCVIDPEHLCKDRGGKCQEKDTTCKGPYLSGFCGKGTKLCCFEADFTKISTTGASEETAKGQLGKNTTLKGIAASEKLAEQDAPHLEKLKDTITKAAEATIIDACIIAAITSRESRGGTVMNNSNSHGAMQYDNGNRKYGATSFEHFQEATRHLVSILREIFSRFPCWSMENKLKGAIAGYNIGGPRVKTIGGMDNGTTGNDYSSDVVARVKWLKNNKTC